MDPLHLFFLDQGFPVEYELDKFNTPQTGTTLRHPQNWLCRLRCNILPRHLVTSPLGNIFWRHARFFPKQPEPQTHSDFNVSLLKQQTRLLLHLWWTYLPCTPNTRSFLHSKKLHFVSLHFPPIRMTCPIQPEPSFLAAPKIEESPRISLSLRNLGTDVY